MKIAFCFAGQGTQFKGMGLDFYNSFEIAKELYDSFPTIKDLCFYDEFDQLKETKYAQKAMLLTSYVMAKVLKSKGIDCSYACGLSLGEYSALAYSDVWDIKDAIDIITYRGELMQNALPLGSTKMAAILGLDRDTISQVLSNIDGVCEIANYNCPGQIVITGENEAVDKAIISLNDNGAKRCVPLNVSGAFHSSLLNDAGIKLKEKLDEYKPSKPSKKIIFNTFGEESDLPINEILKKQISSSVYFEDSINYLIDKGVDTFIEIGPGKALTGFVKKISRDVNVYSLTDVTSLNEIIGGLSK